jgi:hypothetical protein
MAWFRRNERKTGVAPATGVCDVCGASVVRVETYYLRSRDIALSEAYWRKSFTMSKPLHEGFQLTDSQRLSAFGSAVRQVGNDKTPWCVCEDCSELFIFDRDQARSCAVRDVAPEGTGPVDPAGFIQFAASGWEHVYGRWPAGVQQPSASDSCDFCAKKLYSGEITGRIRKDQAEQYRATGILDHAPLSPPREDGVWLSCGICLARTFTRLHRAQGKSG